MTSIFSGQLYRNFVIDNNQYRLENYDVNRFQRTIEQQAAQGQREKELREGLEYHQAKMADLQTKLNELIEKLNNLYKRFIENKAVFRKVNQEPKYYGTSSALNGLPNINATPDTSGYPTGAAGITPDDDYDKIRNYAWNPYFGSKAIDESDKTVNRTFWQQPNEILEKTYTENGAFWSTISYLWGWDLDRINATYATTSNNNSLQVNVTALQPNKPQYPPMRVGDRFPLFTGNPADYPGYPAIMINGLRPGGVDYSHATDTINTGGDSTAIYGTANILTGNGAGNPPGGNPIVVDDASIFNVNDVITVVKNDSSGGSAVITFIDYANNKIWTDQPAGSNNSSGTISKQIGGTSSKANFNVVGKDSINWGWEFDDLPLALEVVEVETRPDGTTVPTQYKVVYDIPPTHPHYESLKVLNGTEPQIIDAPVELKKVRIRNDGFNYLGKLHFPGVMSSNFEHTVPAFRASSGGPGIGHNPGENEMPPPRLFGTAPPTPPTYTVTNSGNGGSTNNPLKLSPHANSTYDDFSIGETLTTNGTPASVQVVAIQLNTAVATGTGNGTVGNPTVINEPTTIFSDPPYAFPIAPPTDGGRGGDNDVYIKFSGDATNSVYRVTIADTGGIVYTKYSGSGPVNYAPANGEIISIWSDPAATLPRWPAEGLVLNSDVNASEIYKQAVASTSAPVGSITLTSCTPLPTGFNLANARLSMQYRFTVHQNYKQFGSPWDDGLTVGVDLPAQNHTNHDWSSAGQEYVGGNAYPHGTYAFPINTVPFSYLSDAPAGGVIPLGQAPSMSTLAWDAWFTGREQVWAEMRIVNSTTLALDIFFQGDLNNFQMEVQDVELVAYAGGNNGTGNWVSGKHTPGNVPINDANPNNVWVGDPTVTPVDDPNEVINKYIPGVYQYTQFNDQYNIQHSTGNRNDILRSPWEFALLNIGEDSKLSGELWLDLNGRRLNFDHDLLEATTGAWDGTSTVAISNPGGDYILSPAVQNATDFINIATSDPNFHPGDDCNLNRSYQFSDDDPLTSGSRIDTLMDEVMPGELHVQSTLTDLNPIRTANPVLPPASPGQPNFYSLASITSPPSGYTSSTPSVSFTPHSFIYGTDTDNGTIDRIGASDHDFRYTITIPTNDPNVLRNENNLAVNFGSMDETDWTLDLKDLHMDIRVATGYITVPRYRVDAGGNIYDAFGKGYYNPADANDAQSIARVYTVSDAGMSNDQISNYDSRLADANLYGSYNTTYAAAATFEDYVRNHDRLSMGGVANGNDDYNLFDYVPDLNLVPNDTEGRRYGEVYVGSLPSNFYYYREQLDLSVGSDGTAATPSPTGNSTLMGGPKDFNGDGMGAINFDGRKSNMAGTYNQTHTYVHNPNMPAFANVTLGYVEQNAKLYNTERTTSQAVWLGFPGLGGETRYAENVVSSTNVGIDANTNGIIEPSEVDAVNALGNNTAVATMNPGGSRIILSMGTEVNRGGTLIVNERNALGDIDPHIVPLPLLNYSAPYPDFDDPDDPNDPIPTSFTFNAYGAETVTRTGSRFMDFKHILDGVDGQLDGSYDVNTSMGLLTQVGGEFAIDDPAGSPQTWPNGVLLHVDNAEAFDMEYPKNIVTLGTSPTEYRVVYRNTSTYPQTIFLIRNDGVPLTNTLPGATTVPDFIHADLQVRAKTGQYTVQVTDAAGNPDPHGSYVTIDYDDLDTQQPGLLASVGISSDYDRVGRLAGDDPRTPTVETNRIAPELFDSPHGYVQPDAQVALKLVAQDGDGNPRPRRLKAVRVDVMSGEQLIPSTLIQRYSTDGEGADPSTGTVGTFSYNDGAGHWPIALFEEDTQINPVATTDLNYFVGLFQGITASNATAATPTVTVQDTFGFSVGQKVTINGERRTIADISGNVLTLDAPLSQEPKVGDVVSVGNGLGTQDIQMYLNRSWAMSMGAAMKVTLEWEEYDVIGFPPRVDTSSTRSITETIGFTDSAPNQEMVIASTNTGTTTLTVDNTTGFAVNDLVNVNGLTRKITALTATTVTLDQPVTTSLGQPLTSGTISHHNYENFLVVGTGRTGGSKENEFTEELKRILDNPEYKDVLRMGLLKNVFISASTNDQFNNLVSSKLFLNWDRIRKQVEIQQTSFMAYYKSV